MILLLEVNTLSVNKIVIGYFYVRIDDDDYAPTSCFYFGIHLRDRSFSEIFGIEFEILVACIVIVLLGPLNVGPEHVDREPIFSEILISVHEDIR